MQVRKIQMIGKDLSWKAVLYIKKLKCLASRIIIKAYTLHLNV